MPQIAELYFCLMLSVMRNAFVFLTLFLATLFSVQAVAQNKPAHPTAYTSPLSSFSTKWDDAKYKVCNTAATANYMTDTEKLVICILNMARMDPHLFEETVLTKYPATTKHSEEMTASSYYQSLVRTMHLMDTVGLLYPYSLCFESANCHAITSARADYTGHDRQTKACKAKEHFLGECCDYGRKAALDIIMHLLIDESVPSLGHREACLDRLYTKLGVSIQAHPSHRYIAVLDFY